MAITINGSGTITGVSTGGLPDGIVDAGTLADNAVGLAQMASGTDGEVITYDASGNPATVSVGTSGHVLTSTGAGAAPTMQAAAAGGKVLQVVESTTDTQVSTSNVSWTDLLTLSITPVSSSSQLYVDTVFNAVVYTASKPWSQSLCKFRIYDVTNTTELNSTVIGGKTYSSDFSSQWMQNDVSMKAKVASTGTSARSFKIQGYSWSSWYTYRVFCDAVEYASSYTSNNVGMISITEIGA